MMRPPAPRHLRPPRRRGRVVAALTALVLGANALVLGSGWTSEGSASEPGHTDVAAAAVTLATTAEPAVEADLGPMAGVEVRVPVQPQIDPSAPLPVPEPAPANAYASTPEVRHGQLEIPAIGLSQPLFEGVTLTAINRGPSHWPGTAMPGEVGNVVIAGHRTTYTKPFWALNELNPGDELIFTVGGERIVYELERTEIVTPDAMHVVDQTHELRATLFACHPRGSARQRIVGHFRLKPQTVTYQFFDTLGPAGPN